MKKYLEIHQLEKKQVDFLLQQSQPRKFNVAETLVYESQVPLAGYVLISGSITIHKKGSPIQEVPVNGLICLFHLLENTPLKQEVRISPGSEALILDKSTAREILEQKSDLFLTA